MRRTRKRDLSFLNDVGNFLRRVLRSIQRGKTPLFLTTPIPQVNEEAVFRKRAEYARDLLGSVAFQDAIQFMNEQVVTEIANTDPLDTDRLLVLRLRLELNSEFPQALHSFIDHYETIVAIREQEEERMKDYLDN